MHYSGADGLLSPLTRGVGAILTLHQVEPEATGEFSPNRILRITPYFLERTINQLLEAGFECVSMDEVANRVANPGRNDRPFVAFTLDDAYRDNLVHAQPVFQRYGIPYCIYAPTDFLDGNGDLWWLTLEHAIAAYDVIEVEIEGESLRLPAVTCAEKEAAFHKIYWRLREIDETTARAIVAGLAERAGLDHKAFCRNLVMNWAELRQIASDPLATIGAHTVRHYALAKLGSGAAKFEIEQSIHRLADGLGRKVEHFSYPFGDRTSAGPREFEMVRALGMKTAVTTRKGLLRSGDDLDPVALPRLSLNGDYQDPLYTKVLLSGLPFALLDLARRVVPQSLMGSTSRPSA